MKPFHINKYKLEKALSLPKGRGLYHRIFMKALAIIQNMIYCVIILLLTTGQQANIGDIS